LTYKISSKPDVERYLGHSPDSITERHYHGDQGDRMVALFRTKVVEHVDAEIDEWNGKMNSSIVPEKNVVILNSEAS